MNIHNELFFMYRDGHVDSADILTAYDKGHITIESCNAILAQSPDYTLEQIIKAKSDEFNYFCSKNISKGVDITLADGTTEHFSLTTDDQLNINRAFMQVIAGETDIEYHADGKPFKNYSAADISTIYGITQGKVNSETIYRNNLREWINQLKDVEEIRKITYGTPIPEEYWTEGWRSVQEKIAEQLKANEQSTEQTGEANAEPVLLSEEQHAVEETTKTVEEAPKESIVQKAVKAVTKKTRKKKAEAEEATTNESES